MVMLGLRGRPARAAAAPPRGRAHG